ncbi:hypothetical protein AAUPMB_00725, partial [Pasteurella multocida subsp. multocida str. Anand1_buffalo]
MLNLKGEVYKEIVKHIETQNGVCESLVHIGLLTKSLV